MKWNSAAKSHMNTGDKWNDRNFLLRDGARVAAKWDNYDVLVRYQNAEEKSQKT